MKTSIYEKQPVFELEDAWKNAVIADLRSQRDRVINLEMFVFAFALLGFMGIFAAIAIAVNK